MNPSGAKKGKRKPKIQTFPDKYAHTGTFTAMSSSAGSSTAKTTVDNITLGYDQPLKKPKPDETVFQASVAADQKSKEPNKEESRSQVNSQFGQVDVYLLTDRPSGRFCADEAIHRHVSSAARLSSRNRGGR